MNTLTKSPASPIVIISLLSVMTTLAVSHLSATAEGNGVNGEEFIFGSVGITATQTARLNVVNTATDGSIHTRALSLIPHEM